MKCISHIRYGLWNQFSTCERWRLILFANIFHSSELRYLVLISFTGLFLVEMLLIYPPLAPVTFWRKPFVGLIFGLICILGIFASLFPTMCSRILHFGKNVSHDNNLDKITSPEISLTLQGHHPNCGNFVAHIFRIGDNTFCAACTGLFFGGIFVLIGSIQYFFCSWHVGLPIPLMIHSGVLGVGLGLFQFKFKSYVRFFLNTSFVIGTFLILIGFDKLLQSITIDGFIIGLILLWLFTRIFLSQWDHDRICQTCKIITCEFGG